MMSEPRGASRITIVAILSVSLLTLMANAAVSPALAVIAAAFPDVNRTVIKLILTLPAVFVIPATFSSAALVKRWGARRVLLAGLACYLLGGAGGSLAPSFPILLATRGLLGIGVGLIIPISTSLPTAFFAGEQRMAMMGRITASNYTGGIIVQISSGWLATFGWHWSFTVYLLAVPALILVSAFLPETEKGETRESTGRLPLKVILAATAMFWIMIALYCIPTNLALLVARADLGDSRTVGLLSGLMMLASMVGGLTVVRLRRTFGRGTMAAELTSLAAGFALIALARNVIEVSAGQMLAGLALGGLIPQVMIIVQSMAPRDKVVLAMAVSSSMLYLGQFMSPIILDGTARLLFGGARPDLAFAIVAGGCGCLAAFLVARLALRRSGGGAEDSPKAP